ncbi:MAG TPA: phage tail protein [Polyangia bacterium]|jgi:phage tail-like protein|nr:phage tail protein [Polyangia bacterium]
MIQTPRALIKMPEVVGLPLRKAQLLLENVGLQVESVLFRESYDERDTVLEQKPVRGQMIYVGEKVTLMVSRESYIKWLPSIYQRSDVSGRNFLRDLLWITQHLFGAIEDQLDFIHTYFDPYESPKEFLPWLAGWTAMVVEEDWPIEKKRLLIKKAIEIYKIRGTVRGVKLFISLFTGNEPEIVENAWPFRGFRIGVTSGIGVDSIILPPVNLAHTFLVEMPVTYKDISVESVIRLHEIIQMEKPAHTSYYLRFLAEQRLAELRDFFHIAVRSGIGIGQEVIQPLPVGGLELIEQAERELERERELRPADMPLDDNVEEFIPPWRGKTPLPKAPRADNAPIEGQEVRTSLAGGFDQGAREMLALTEEELAAMGGTPKKDEGDGGGSTGGGGAGGDDGPR